MVADSETAHCIGGEREGQKEEGREKERGRAKERESSVTREGGRERWGALEKDNLACTHTHSERVGAREGEIEERSLERGSECSSLHPCSSLP